MPGETETAIVLGAIADDFTGATDLANALTRQGMRTLLTNGVPEAPPAGVDAVVVALKTRTIDAALAVEQSLAALAWLAQAGVRQVYFKYCSTFDSTDRGNIGPVADALLAALEAPATVVCPAFPGAGRTIYRGHLFVGDRLLSESPMRDHPLTPMTDPDLVRVMARQSAGSVGLVPQPVVAEGAQAVRRKLDELAKAGHRYAVLDVIADPDLSVLGEAVADLKLVTGGSGLAIGLPAAYRRRGWLPPFAPKATLPAADPGPAVVLAGSCSQATQGQVAAFRTVGPSRQLDPMVLEREPGELDAAIAWVAERMARGPVLVYSTADPASVAASQRWLGRERASDLLESAFARMAVALVERGARRLVVAGGETSGAVVQALKVAALRIGPEIAPGVPWTVTAGGRPVIALALKSGNFGGPDFFARALEQAP